MNMIIYPDFSSYMECHLFVLRKKWGSILTQQHKRFIK